MPTAPWEEKEEGRGPFAFRRHWKPIFRLIYEASHSHLISPFLAKDVHVRRGVVWRGMA